MEVHIVVKGDTLWKIARQYGIPFEELKKANAHLAKSEYIVPGMKIFLPNKVHGGKQEPAKHPDKGKIPVKPTQPTAPPTHQKPTKPTKPAPPIPTQPTRPTQPKPTPPVPTHPAKPTHPKPAPPVPTHPAKPTHPKPTPRPPVPTPPVEVPQPLPLPTPSLPTPPRPPAPVPTPPVQVTPPLPLPTPSLPTPPPVPMPMPPIQIFPMQPCMHHPMIGIPCGWMPIFDADCQPFMHSGQIQAMPMPPASEQPAPLPLPTPSLPSTQFPMYEEECEESPIFSSQGPATMPMVEGWQLIESPENLYEESPEWNLQPSPWCPPEQGYIPQALSPAMQQGGFPMMPFPAYQQGCGCGCDGQHNQHHNQHQYPMMMMPLFYGHPCNCQSSMQPTPYQMMPTPYQGSNWYGSY